VRHRTSCSSRSVLDSAMVLSVVRQAGRAHELATTADAHARDAFLPALDQSCEREADRLPAPPRGVELLARPEVDTEVVDEHLGTRCRLVALAADEVADLEVLWWLAAGEVDLRLLGH